MNCYGTLRRALLKNISLSLSASVSPTSSIDSTTVVMSPTRVTAHATITRSQNFSKPSNAPSNRLDPDSTDTNRLSTLLIVVIAVSGAVTAVITGLAVFCYIGRKRRNKRFQQPFMIFCYLLKWIIDLWIKEQCSFQMQSRRWRGLVVRALDLQPGGPGLKSSSLLLAGFL